MSDDTPTTDKKALTDEFGFATGDLVFVETTPAWYGAAAEEAAIELTPDLPATHAHLFFGSNQELHEFMAEYDINEVEKSLWFSWPNQASGIKTDLNDQMIRDIILPLGWVENGLLEVDNNWSGLQFIRAKNNS